MTAPGRAARAKGNRAEVAVAKWLRAHGWPEARTTRDARGGSQGGADITGVPGWSIEVKDRATLALGKWWDQTCRDAEDGDPVLIVKPPRVADVGQWITFRLHDWPWDELPRIAEGASFAQVLTVASVLDDWTEWRCGSSMLIVARLERIRRALA